MVNIQTIDLLRELYEIVGDRDFAAKDIPKKYYKLISKLESSGYIIKSGTVKYWYYDRQKTYQQYRIAERYLQKLRTLYI